MIPKTIKILGREYKIRRKRMKKAEWAFCEDDTATIWMRSGIKGETAEQTLLHEVIHALLFRSGHKFDMTPGQEEAIVRAMESGLWDAGYRLSE